MPRAIISPSVLASDFGQLTAECKRMIKGGAEWLHMGASRATPVTRCPTPILTFLSLQMLWTGEHRPSTRRPSDMLIVSQTLRPKYHDRCVPDRVRARAPLLTISRSACPGVGRKVGPWRLYGLPYDGFASRTSAIATLQTPHIALTDGLTMCLVGR